VRKLSALLTYYFQFLLQLAFCSRVTPDWATSPKLEPSRKIGAGFYKLNTLPVNQITQSKALTLRRIMYCPQPPYPFSIQCHIIHVSIPRAAPTETSDNTHTYNHYTALFPGPPRWASARRELLDIMVQGEINRGRHTDHPAGRHSIRTNQCPPPPSPKYYFMGRIPFLPPNQQCQSTEDDVTVINCSKYMTDDTHQLHLLWNLL